MGEERQEHLKLPLSGFNKFTLLLCNLIKNNKSLFTYFLLAFGESFFKEEIRDQ
jgi:hypothetical protein